MYYFAKNESNEWECAEQSNPDTIPLSDYLTILREEISTWDHEDIMDLAYNLSTYAILSVGEGVPEIDCSSLPTEPIPTNLESYPIWSIDKQGMCLVGQSADEIENITDIINHYNNKGV
jgi:hypothetical protein